MIGLLCWAYVSQLLPNFGLDEGQDVRECHPDVILRRYLRLVIWMSTDLWGQGLLLQLAGR